MDTLIGNHTQEGRLFQLHRQPLSKRVVKYWVACLINEVGEDNCILVGELLCVAALLDPSLLIMRKSTAGPPSQ